MAKFNVGDKVVKNHGHTIAEVISMDYNYMDVRWEKSGKRSYSEYVNGYRLATEAERNKQGAKDMTALYEVKVNGETKIATKLMEKSKTSWIMEIKGSGDVIVVDASDVQEIVKYTIEVRYGEGKTVHYEATAGQYKVDEVYLMGNTLQIARIVKLDSKSKTASTEFKPFAKLVVEV